MFEKAVGKHITTYLHKNTQCITIPSRAIDSNKIPSAKHGKPPSELLVRRSKSLPEQYRLSLLSLVASELTTKMPHTEGVGLGRMGLELPWKTPPLEPARRGSQGAMPAAKGGKQSTVLCSCDEL